MVTQPPTPAAEPYISPIQQRRLNFLKLHTDDWPIPSTIHGRLYERGAQPAATSAPASSSSNQPPPQQQPTPATTQDNDNDNDNQQQQPQPQSPEPQPALPPTTPPPSPTPPKEEQEEETVPTEPAVSDDAAAPLLVAAPSSPLPTFSSPSEEALPLSDLYLPRPPPPTHSPVFPDNGSGDSDGDDTGGNAHDSDNQPALEPPPLTNEELGRQVAQARPGVPPVPAGPVAGAVQGLTGPYPVPGAQAKARAVPWIRPPRPILVVPGQRERWADIDPADPPLRAHFAEDVSETVFPDALGDPDRDISWTDWEVEDEEAQDREATQITMDLKDRGLQ